MKEIVIACGSGIATSTAVAAKIAELLDSNGFNGQYHLQQCSIAEAVGKSKGADLIIATTAKPDGIECPFISGIAFLTGMGKAAVEQQIVDFIKE